MLLDRCVCRLHITDIEAIPSAVRLLGQYNQNVIQFYF